VWFPAVGLLLGGILALADLALQRLPVSSLLESSVLVVLLLGLTGGLHADGLMDTCDAAFAHATPERRLEIMRDPRVGSFGVVGLVSVLLLKVAAIDALPAAVRAQGLLVAPVLGRWAIVLLAAVFPAGRSSGLGAPVKAAASPRLLALASAVPILACLGVGPTGPWLLALAGGSTLLIGWWLCRLLPGLTGDCYGAACECVETLVLVVAGSAGRVFVLPA
jgi:adenosylcobinamide-GDP ribazoletransferase